MAPRAAFIGVASGFASTLSAAGAPVSRAALAPALAFPLALGVGGSSMEQKSQNHPCGARRSANSHSPKSFAFAFALGCSPSGMWQAQNGDAEEQKQSLGFLLGTGGFLLSGAEEELQSCEDLRGAKERQGAPLERLSCLARTDSSPQTHGLFHPPAMTSCSDAVFPHAPNTQHPLQQRKVTANSGPPTMPGATHAAVDWRPKAGSQWAKEGKKESSLSSCGILSVSRQGFLQGLRQECEETHGQSDTASLKLSLRCLSMPSPRSSPRQIEVQTC